MWRNRKRYHEMIGGGLDEARREAEVRDVALEDLRLIVFSDLHRGVGDGADDFRACRKIYHAALGYYDALDFTLFLLGDVEELWERLLVGIVNRYEGTLDLERAFFERGKGIRFLGNHDDSLTRPWNRPLIERHLAGEKPRNGLVLRVREGEAEGGAALGDLLFVHGHQGIRYTGFDRFVVRRLWAPVQRLTGLGAGVPSADMGLRLTHERALYDWAARRGLLLVCGHTHHPVFMSAAWEQTLRAELERLRENGADPRTLAIKRAELQWAAADLDEMKTSLPADARPCYFNTGCCSFSDGTITGIEFADGRIRLVRWTGTTGLPVREVLREADLAGVLNQCTNGEHEDLSPDLRTS